MAENGAAANINTQPQLNVLAQYVKDLSFENPNAPQSLNPQQGGPGVNIQVNINVRDLGSNDYETSLKLEGSGEQAGSVMFKFEVDYAGVFRLTNVPENDVHPILHIECPRLLFPFARQIVADAMRNGGFPPLLIDPIDFVSLYQQRVAGQGPEQGGATLQA